MKNINSVLLNLALTILVASTFLLSCSDVSTFHSKRKKFPKNAFFILGHKSISIDSLRSYNVDFISTYCQNNEPVYILQRPLDRIDSQLTNLELISYRGDSVIVYLNSIQSEENFILDSTVYYYIMKLK